MLAMQNKKNAVQPKNGSFKDIHKTIIGITNILLSVKKFDKFI